MLKFREIYNNKKKSLQEMFNRQLSIYAGVQLLCEQSYVYI